MTLAQEFHKLFQLNGDEFAVALYAEILERHPAQWERDSVTHKLNAGIRKHEILSNLLQGSEANHHYSDSKPPIGMYPTAQEWFAHYMADSPYPDESAQYIPFPAMDGPLLFPQPEVPYLFHPGTPPRQSVSVIPWGRVAGRNGGVLTPDNKLLWEVSMEFNKPHDLVYHSLCTSWNFSPAAFLDETVGVLTSAGSYNYYHWMFDVLPRIELLRQSGIHLDRYLINRLGGYDFQRESLALLGVSEEQLMEVDGQSHIRARRLVVPSMAGFSGNVPKLACELLRRRLLPERGGSQPYRRIYVSRSLAQTRKIMNEPELVDLLHRYSFQCVWLEKMTFGEQLRLFHEAEAIVAPHGAGLANLVFCQPGTRVVELIHPKVANPCYLALSQKVDLIHRGFVAQADPPSCHYAYQHGDIYVDVKRLKETLNDIGVYVK